MKTVVRILLVVLALAVIVFASTDLSFSENENRMLKTKDTISGRVIDGSFQSDLETYLSDQFPLRTFCTAMQTKIKLLLGRKDIGGAYIGSDGRLFQKITNSDISLSEIEAHAGKYARMSAAGQTPLCLLPVPSAGCMAPDLLPKNAQMYDHGSVIEAIQAEAPDAFICDLRDTMQGHTEYYYKTDHHWTTRGAYEAYLVWCKKNGLTALDWESLSPRTVTDSFRGTLYSKVLDPSIKGEDMQLIAVPDGLRVTADGEEIDFYNMQALETKDKYNVFLSGNHGIVEIENPDCDNDQTLLIVKDSFANSLVPFLIYHYQKIVLLDERYTAVVLSDFAESIGANEIAVIKEAAFF